MDKPFKTHDELIELLHRRGLKTDSRTKFILEREGYYSAVNGYKDQFLDRLETLRLGHDVYKNGCDFYEIYNLFVMDRHLRTVLFRYITLAEAFLKTATTYEFCLCHQNDNEAYLKQSNYRQDKRYQELITHFIEELNRIAGKDAKSPKYMKPYLEHYIKNHDNVPLWVIMNNLSLGQAFKFYDFQTESIRFHVAKRFQNQYNQRHTHKRRITHKNIYNAYNNIKEFRNICAHDERVYCAKVGKSRSVTFADVLKNLEITLTQKQFEALLNDIYVILVESKMSFHTIKASDIVPAMGLNSLADLNALNWYKKSHKQR